MTANLDCGKEITVIGIVWNIFGRHLNNEHSVNDIVKQKSA